MAELHLLIVDPQRDFCDPNGALSVPGADADMARLASFVQRHGERIARIHCTLDSHHLFDISHPAYWVDREGNHPTPFTIIESGQVQGGEWSAARADCQAHAESYVRQLSDNDRYPLCIWPPHCLIGTRGHTIAPSLAEALQRWETLVLSGVDYVLKGANTGTEHYSALKADVPDPDDPSSEVNLGLLERLRDADTVVVAGEATSHCVRFTVEDLAEALGDAFVGRMVLLTDCGSPVAGFGEQAAAFVDGMVARGMQTATSESLFA